METFLNCIYLFTKICLISEGELVWAKHMAVLKPAMSKP